MGRSGQGHPGCHRNHYSCYWGLCVGFLLVTIITNPVTSVTTEEESGGGVVVQCAGTKEGLRRQVIRCLTKGERFFKKYFKRYDSKSFQRCREYESFGECINTLVDACPAAHDILPREWKTATQLMNCACNHGDHDKKTSACVGSLNCMEEELNMVFSQHCDRTYQSNLDQNTQDHCHFLTEYILCTERVVGSACGEDVGSLLYLAHKVAAWNTYQCDVSRWDAYQGFEYSASCPRNLSQSMDGCLETGLDAKVLTFKEDNDLIPKEDTEAVKLACSAYQNYQACLTPLNSSCPHGVKAALQQMDILRIYRIKMDFYCDPNNADFLDNVACYQDVLDKGLLNSCGDVWTRIQDALQNMTAFKFYCMEASPDTLLLKNELDNLRGCHQLVITKQCGQSAGVAMSNLISLVFQDPMFLRLEYKPDCQLHTMESLSNRTPSPRQPHHRGKHHRHRHKGGKKGHGKDKPEEVKTGRSVQTGSAPRSTEAGYFCYSLTVAIFLLQSSLVYWSAT